MNIERINKMLDAVQAAYAKASEAQSHWLEYRRLSAQENLPTDDPKPFIDAMRLATEAARKIAAMRDKLQDALLGDGLLRANMLSADGKRSLSVVLIRPDAKMSHASITQSAYDALRRMLGEGITTTAPFDIVVVGRGGRIALTIPAGKMI